MRVFVAGATGAIGQPLVDRLFGERHAIVAMTRSESRARALRERGAEGVVADALDVDAVRRAVGAARPEVVVHQLTALPKDMTPKALTVGTLQRLATALGVQ